MGARSPSSSLQDPRSSDATMIVGDACMSLGSSTNPLVRRIGTYLRLGPMTVRLSTILTRLQRTVGLRSRRQYRL